MSEPLLLLLPAGGPNGDDAGLQALRKVKPAEHDKRVGESL
jgi:hypothetical protein